MIAAVVLSAGESSRMGRPKALLPIEGETFIGRIVASLKQTQVGKIIVVLGHNSDLLAAAIRPLAVEILINTNYKLGQLSTHVQKSRRILNDLRIIRKLLVNEYSTEPAHMIAAK